MNQPIYFQKPFMIAGAVSELESIDIINVSTQEFLIFCDELEKHISSADDINYETIEAALNEIFDRCQWDKDHADMMKLSYMILGYLIEIKEYI